MLPLPLALLGVLVTVLLAAGAALAGALTPRAAAVAALFGALIVVIGGFAYLALLVLFVVASSLATRYRFQEKLERHLQEGRHGERGVSNVVAHILIPTALVVLSGLSDPLLPPGVLALLFVSALAFGASDTFASEFGVLSGKVRSLLTGRRVLPGTNGGVSTTGELFAFGAAAGVAVAGVVLFALFGTPLAALPIAFGVPTLAGFLGCQIDSVLGEVWENRGRLSKGGTNLLGMASSVAIAALLLVPLGAMG